MRNRGRLLHGLHWVADALTVLSIISAASLYWLERSARSQAALFEAWSIVTRMEGRSADGGRQRALMELLRRRESLAGVVLTHAIMKNTDLSGSDLSHALVDEVRFSRVLLRHAYLSDTKMVGSHFENRCDFTGTFFENVQLAGATFVDAALSEARLVAPDGDAATSFNGAELRDSEISNGNFDGTNFENADFTRARMMESHAMGARFQRAQFHQFRMTNTSASQAEFQHSSGSGATFERSILDGTRFDATSLIDPTFRRASLRRAVFFGANLRNARFYHSDLRGADFTSADLSYAEFCDSKLDGAIFTNARRPTDLAFTSCNDGNPQEAGNGP